MAPGAFAILAPLLRRKKKYEKLETEDPEKKAIKSTSSRASNDEMDRLNTKIEKLVTSLSKEDVEPASNVEEECIVCNQSKAVMQVAPCGHQSQCRICFIYKIQEAVSTRDLPLRCLICNVKIFRVKNNSHKRKASSNTSSWSEAGHKAVVKPLAKSVSGYSIVLGMNEFPHSDSNHSLSSDVSNVSTQSKDSRTSLRSSSSWFSLGSLSSFQAGSFLPDRATLARAPRAHSLITKNNNQPRICGKPANDNQSPPVPPKEESLDNNNNPHYVNLNNTKNNEQRDELRSSSFAYQSSTGSRASNLRRSRTIPNDMGSNKRRGTDTLLDPSFSLGARSPPDLAETAFSMGTIAEEED